jgi:beta-phosphoglucomutase-like phosphatase (HAD superfamily)
MTPPATPESIIAAYEPAALVFDFDGTLADSSELHEQSLRIALADRGISLDPGWYRAHTGLPIADLISLLAGEINLALPTTDIIAASRAWLSANLHQLQPIPAAVDLARFACAQRLPCAVASSASHELVDPGLRALGLANLFVAVVAAEDVSVGKPHPEVFLRAAELLDCPPASCLAVEDSRPGLAAARAAGMKVLAVAAGTLLPTQGGEAR